MTRLSDSLGPRHTHVGSCCMPQPVAPTEGAGEDSDLAALRRGAGSTLASQRDPGSQNVSVVNTLKFKVTGNLLSL